MTSAAEATKWHPWVRAKPIIKQGPCLFEKRSKSSQFERTAEGVHRRQATLSLFPSQAPVCNGTQCLAAGKMGLGDVSWHHGWLLHHAPAQPPGSPARLALAVSYFADGAKVIQQPCQDHGEDRESYDAWYGREPGKLVSGQLARHALLPLVNGT